MKAMHKLALGLATGVVTIGTGLTLHTQHRFGTDPLTHVFRPVQQITTLSAHADEIYSLEFSPDGQSIFTSSLRSGLVWEEQSPDIKEWDVTTGEALAVLSNPIGHEDTQWVAFDATTRRLAFASQEPILERWDLSTGQPLPLPLPSNLQDYLITQHLISGNGQVVATRRYQPEIGEWSVLLWDVETGSTLTHISLAGREKLALNQDGSQLAVVTLPPESDTPTMATVWDVVDGSPRHERELSLVDDRSQSQNRPSQTDNLTLSQIGFAGETLWFRSSKDTWQQWDLATNTLTEPSNNTDLEIAREPQNRPTVFSPDGQLVALRDAYEVEIREVGSRRLVTTFEAEAGGSLLAFSPDSQTLMGENFDGSLSVWDITTGIEQSQVQSRTSRFGRQVRLEENVLLIAGSRGIIQIWNGESGQLLAQIRNPDDPWFAWISLIPSGPLATRSDNRTTTTIRLWDVSTAASIMASEAEYLSRFAMADQGKLVFHNFSWLPNSPIEVWDLETQTKQVISPEPEEVGTIYSLALRGERLAVSVNNRIDLISIPTGDRMTSIPMSCRGADIHWDGCWRTRVMSFSADGQMLAFVSGSYEMTLWQSSGQRVVRRIVVPEDFYPVTSLALSPDGRLLAAGDVMGNLHLWQVPRSFF